MNSKTRLLATVDKAALTLHEGFVSATFGWRGAVLFYLVLGSLTPLASFANALWIGVFLFVSGNPDELGMNAAAFYALCVCFAAAGVAGMWFDLRAMAKRQIKGRRPQGPIAD